MTRAESAEKSRRCSQRSQGQITGASKVHGFILRVLGSWVLSRHLII